jgi:hypothetical protein
LQGILNSTTSCKHFLFLNKYKMITNQQTFYVKSSIPKLISGITTSFSYNLNLSQDGNADRVVLLSALIPKSYHLVQQDFSFTLSEGKKSQIITMPVGTYNRRGLLNTVQNLLNSASQTMGNNFAYVITIPNTNIGPETGLYTFTVSNNVGVQPIITFGDVIYDLLGFNLNSTNTFVGNVLISPNCCKLISNDCLYLNSDICNNGTDNILEQIFVSSNPDYSNIIYTCPDIESCSKRLVNAHSGVFSFSLTDEDGIVVDLSGLHITLKIMVYKRNDIWDILRNAIGIFLQLLGKN